MNNPLETLKNLQSGKIVVNADEWTLSNTGFKEAPDTATFVTNIAKWFTGGRSTGKFHAYSTNFGLSESELAQTMATAGYTWTVGNNMKFDLPTLLTYDGIFLCGDLADNQVLIDYVKAGGNVYLGAGTGVAGAQAEADSWNTFLNAFGLKFLGVYNGISGNQSINSAHPIFAGVKAIYQSNGNSIVDILDPVSQTNQLILTHATGQGLIAAFEGSEKTNTLTTVNQTNQLSKLGCENENKLRSLEGGAATSINFVNKTSALVKVYWINYQGQRQFYKDLKAGESYTQSTYVNHPWVVTDEQGGCLGIFQPEGERKDAIIESFSGQGQGQGTSTQAPSPESLIVKKRKKQLKQGTSTQALSPESSQTPQIGKIVVNADEWTLSNTGFKEAPDTATFVTNIAKWFTGGRSTGKFHAYSTNFGLSESELAQTMATAGYTWTVGNNMKFDLPTLLTYDGIFLCGDLADNQVLIDYVEAGGNVYLAVGALDDGQQEANNWNTFLNALGLKLSGLYNGISGNQAVNSEHPIFAGVKAIYQNNGNPIVNLDPASQTTQLLLTQANGQGLIAVAGSEKTNTPSSQPPESSQTPQIGKIVVNADEWTLSNTGFAQAPDTATFVTNIAKWFTGGRSTGKFHAYSTNFGLTESDLAQTMATAGYTWTVGNNMKFDLPTLLTYDGIFLCGDLADNQVLIDYVKAGGNVYLAVGTLEDSQQEANNWYSFLKVFGLKLLGVYNSISGNQSVNSEHPIFAGVKAIYQNNSNPIVNLDPASQTNQIILTQANGQGLIATFEGSQKTNTQTTVNQTNELSKLGCENENKLRSLEGGAATSINFVNKTSALVKVYWINYQGQRQFYKDLKAGESYTQSTYVNHPWVVTDEQGGCLGIFQPEGERKDAIIESFSGQGTSTQAPSPESSQAPQIGKIVVNADEFTLSNTGFTQAPDTATFVTNIAKWFTGGRSTGKFHGYSTNFGLTESVLAQTMAKAGYAWTLGKNIKFDLPTLLTYDGIFLCGDSVDNQVLIDYVKAGGNVYLAAGTGSGGPQQEADSWNTFLNAFGLKLLGVYNGISGNQAVNSEHPIFAGVKAIYQANGNSIVDLDAASQTNQIILTHPTGQGLIAAFAGSEKTNTPSSQPPESSQTPQIGKIVVNADEWTLSNTGFTQAPDTVTFVTNIAKWFTGGRNTGKFHGYSTNFGLTESVLAQTMAQAGYAWTLGKNIKFDLPTLLTYDGIFLCGDSVDNQVLIDYVKAGGNVYLAVGTLEDSQQEANNWNTFLNALGLKLSGLYNGISGNQAVNSEHPIFAGVKAIYQNNGNPIVNLDPASQTTQLLLTQANGQGLIAVAGSEKTNTPLSRPVAFKVPNGQYLVAENGGSGSLLANSDRIKTWETFRLITLENGKVALQAPLKQEYLSVLADGNFAWVGDIKEYEKFDLVRMADNKVALKGYHGKYISIQQGGGGTVIANGLAIKEWEILELIELESGISNQKKKKGKEINTQEGKRKKRRKKANTIILEFDSQKKDKIRDFAQGKGRLLKKVAKTIANLQQSGEIDDRAQPVIAIITQKKSSSKTFWD